MRQHTLYVYAETPSGIRRLAILRFDGDSKDRREAIRWVEENIELQDEEILKLYFADGSND